MDDAVFKAVAVAVLGAIILGFAFTYFLEPHWWVS